MVRKYTKTESKYLQKDNEYFVTKLKEAAQILHPITYRKMKEFKGNPRPLGIPSICMYVKRFGSWNNALIAAGIPIYEGTGRFEKGSSRAFEWAKRMTIAREQKPRDTSKKRKIGSKRRFAILKRDKFTCQYCGKTPQDGTILDVDHIIPFSKGGKSIPINLITSCSDCNKGKSNIIFTDFPYYKQKGQIQAETLCDSPV